MAVNTLQTSAVDPQIAAAIALQERMEPLRNALGIDDLTPQELSLFSMICLRLELDPFARQIYAIRRKGKLTTQIAIDGFRSSAEATGEYRGSDEPTFGPIVDKPFPHPEWAQVTVHRQIPDGSRIAQSATVWWDEYYPGDGNDGFKWRQSPRTMLSKCAEAAGLRKAFPRRFGQVYVVEEMQQADAVDAATPVAAITHREQIAAQRASLEAPTTSVAPVAPSAGPRPVQAAPESGGTAPAAAAPRPAPEVASTADGAGDAVTADGEVIEGQATEVEGLGAGDLRQWLRDKLIGITEAREVGMRLFGKDSLDRLTDAERAQLRDELERKAAG